MLLQSMQEVWLSPAQQTHAWLAAAVELAWTLTRVALVEAIVTTTAAHVATEAPTAAQATTESK